MEHETALITGAGSGMGRAIAVTLAGAGVRVVLVGRDRAKLEQTRAELGTTGASALVEPCDVAARDQVMAMVDRVLGAVGAIDILVCNAGINVRRRALDELDPADWDRQIATNLTGAYNLVHFVLPSMRARRRGLVIQICSVSGIRASVLGGAAYSASKFGQAALGLCLAREERERGIRSSVIYPGEVNTPILDARPVPVPEERGGRSSSPRTSPRPSGSWPSSPPGPTSPSWSSSPTADDFA
jgi:NAD(P)-dependent dehydrogenase (short-subunit alcohol dehydrogenase family)